MKKDWFWRGVAICGLLLAGIHIGVMLRGDTPAYGYVQAGGASEGGTIAMTSDNGDNQQRLYVIDPQAKTILVYESRTGGGDFKLMCGRFYGHESKLATLSDIQWNARGYSVQDIMGMLKRIPKGTAGGP